MQSQVHLITGKFLVRSPRTRRAHYADLVKKHSEGISVTDNFCKWKNDADSRVTSVEKRCVNELNKVEGQFSEIKSRAGSFVDNMEEVLKKAYKAAKNINEYMDRSIESRCKIIDSRIEKVEDKCDKSLAKLLQLNNLLVEWKNDVDDCFKSNERRLCSVNYDLCQLYIH